MPELPDGVVTFAFTDVEGSTRLWEDDPRAMEEAMHVLDGLVESTVTESGGYVVKPRGEGDSHFLVFSAAGDAVSGIARLPLHLAGAAGAGNIPMPVFGPCPRWSIEL